MTGWNAMKVLVVTAALTLVGCTSPEEVALALYDQASDARAAGRLAESDQLLEEALTALPEGEVANRVQDLLQAVRSESEDQVLEAMDEIRQAQEAFMSRERRHAQSVEELVFSLMLTEAPDGAAIGYRIRSRSSPAADAYSISAEAVVGIESRRSFFQDLGGVMRWELGGPATADSPALE